MHQRPRPAHHARDKQRERHSSEPAATTRVSALQIMLLAGLHLAMSHHVDVGDQAEGNQCRAVGLECEHDGAVDLACIGGPVECQLHIICERQRHHDCLFQRPWEDQAQGAENKMQAQLSVCCAHSRLSLQAGPCRPTWLWSGRCVHQGIRRALQVQLWHCRRGGVAQCRRLCAACSSRPLSWNWSPVSRQQQRAAAKVRACGSADNKR